MAYRNSNPYAALVASNESETDEEHEPAPADAEVKDAALDASRAAAIAETPVELNLLNELQMAVDDMEKATQPEKQLNLPKSFICPMCSLRRTLPVPPLKWKIIMQTL